MKPICGNDFALKHATLLKDKFPFKCTATLEQLMHGHQALLAFTLHAEYKNLNSAFNKLVHSNDVTERP